MSQPTTEPGDPTPTPEPVDETDQTDDAEEREGAEGTDDVQGHGYTGALHDKDRYL